MNFNVNIYKIYILKIKILLIFRIITFIKINKLNQGIISYKKIINFILLTEYNFPQYFFI